MYLYGAGGHAKVIMDILFSMQIPVDGIFDDSDLIKNIAGHNVSKYSREIVGNFPLILSIGNNEARKKLAESIDVRYGKAIHTSAVISQSVVIGDGTVIMHGAIIQTDTNICKHAIINTAAKIDHDCTIENYVHIAPGATLCGQVHVGEGTLVGAGSTILPGITIGKWATIGAGAVVIKNVPDYAILVGNPAAIIKYDNKRY
jgi:sugar O-acyltransferase (sialic acid O-acetyltransferase NeuD family)